MSHFNPRRLARAERGQTMVLGVLGTLLVALMMLLTLNVGQAIFERIRIQQVADSAAFSNATQEARSFNFFAYTNRANIGSLVAATSANSYMDMASVVPQLFFSAATNLDIMAAEEYDLCCCAPFCPCVIHCFHAEMDQISSMLNNLYGLLTWMEVWDVDRDFADFMEAIDDHMKEIAEAQEEMKDKIGTQLQSDTIASQLRSKFAKQAASNVGSIKSENKTQYEDIFEDDEGKRKWVPTEIANGTRHRRMLYFRDKQTMEDFVNDDTWQKFTNDLVIGGSSEITSHLGDTKVMKQTDMPPSGFFDHPEGQGPGSWDFGTVKTEAFCCQMVSAYTVWLGSGKDKSSHFGMPYPPCMNPGMHKNFECLADGACFTLFKSNPEPSEDFGQPKAYSYFSQDLSKMQDGGDGPWELETDGKVKLDLGEVSNTYDTEVMLADDPAERGEGMAMSKAMTYYHWPEEDDGWKEQPNFFNPYWKAKLHPFRRDEAKDILQKAGHGEFGQLVEAGVPVP